MKDGIILGWLPGVGFRQLADDSALHPQRIEENRFWQEDDEFDFRDSKALVAQSSEVQEGGLGHRWYMQEVDMGFGGFRPWVGVNEIAEGYLGNLGLQTSFAASYLR